MNRTLSLIRYAKLEGKGWRRGSVVLNKNGKLRHPFMMHGGEAIEAPNGRYQLVRYEGKREVYTDLGNDPTDALTRYRAEESKQNVRLAAIAAGLDIPAETTGINPTRMCLTGRAECLLGVCCLRCTGLAT